MAVPKDRIMEEDHIFLWFSANERNKLMATLILGRMVVHARKNK